MSNQLFLVFSTIIEEVEHVIFDIVVGGKCSNEGQELLVEEDVLVYGWCLCECVLADELVDLKVAVLHESQVE